MRVLAGLLLFCALLVACDRTHAADPVAPVVIDPAAPPAPGKWVELKALPGVPLGLSVGATAAKWLPIDEGCYVIPSSDGKTATFFAPSSARYRLVVVVAGEPTRVAVTVGDPVPAPPGPGPGPTPPVPAPVDPLAAKLKAAYAAETAADKSARVKDLALLYRKAAVLSVDPTITTGPLLLARIQNAAAVLVGPTALPMVRAAVLSELNAAVPLTDGLLTAAQHTTAAELFLRLAAILETLP